MKFLDKNILWLLFKLNQWHLYRINQEFQKNQEVSIDNPNKYEVLTPNFDADNFENYADPLKVALKTPHVNNIAVSGTYGSGKSSFLRTFEKNYAEWIYLPISLGTFKDKNKDTISNDTKDSENDTLTENSVEKQNESKDKFELHQDIERSILQQFFYREKDNKVPYSRFKRIRNTTKKEIILHSLLILFILLYSLITFFPENFNKFISIDFILLDKQLLSLVVIFPIVYYFYKMIQLLWNLQISKFNYKRGEITLAKQDKASILNEHLDEILYFFEVSNYNVVIFEDLDRFESPEIFIKLRELNNLINNSKQIDRRVIFVYAIKDDMFIDRERSKFFDFIVPIIPYINPSNSETKLSTKFKTQIDEGKLDKSFLENIALYIDDMRLLLNIYNEYMVYKKNLDSVNLDNNKLLGLVVCKNFYPSEFAKLHYRDGLIYRLFKNKKRCIQLEIKKLERKKNKIKDKIQELKKENLQSLDELRGIYISRFLVSVNCIYFKIDNTGSEYTISQLNQNDTFNLFSKEEKIYCYVKNNYNQPMNASWFNFKNLVESKEEGYTYEERKQILLDKYGNKEDELKKQIIDIDKQIVKIKTSTLQELFENSTISINSTDYKDKDLLLYLARTGFIDENYEHYISYFHKGGISQNDREFLLSVKNQKPLELTFSLSHVQELIKKLTDKEFTEKAILNFDLMKYLLKNNLKYPEKFVIFIKQLSDESEESIDFIFRFLDSSENEYQKLFIKNLTWKNLWNHITENFTQEKQNDFFELIFEALTVEELVSLNNDDSLKKYIEDQTILPMYEGDKYHKYNELISSLDIKFKKIDNAEHLRALLSYIYVNKHYVISKEMIKTIINNRDINIEQTELMQSHLSTIYKSNGEKLIEYIDENINEYIENVFLQIDTNTEETEETILQLLNNENVTFDNKVAILNKENTNITDITEVTDKDIWTDLVKANKIQATWDNLLYYYVEKEKMTSELIDFLNIEENFLELTKTKINNDELFDKDEVLKPFNTSIILSNELSDKAYKYLIKSICFVYISLSIEKLDDKKIDYILKENKLDLTQKNINKLKENFSPKHITLIESFKDQFIEEFDEYELDADDIFELIISKQFDLNEKLNIVQKMNLSLFDENTKLKEIVSKLYIDSGLEVGDLVLFEKMFLGENKYGLELLVSQIDYFDTCETCHTYLVELDFPYNELTIKTAKELLIEDNRIHGLLLEKLKSKGCIGKVTEKKGKLKVNRRRK